MEVQSDDLISGDGELDDLGDRPFEISSRCETRVPAELGMYSASVSSGGTQITMRKAATGRALGGLHRLCAHGAERSMRALPLERLHVALVRTRLCLPNCLICGNRRCGRPGILSAVLRSPGYMNPCPSRPSTRSVS